MSSAGVRALLGGSLLVFSGLLTHPMSRPYVTDAITSTTRFDLSEISTGVLAVIVLAGVVSGTVMLPSDTAQTPEPETTEQPEVDTNTNSTTSGGDNTDSSDGSTTDSTESQNTGEGTDSADTTENSSDSTSVEEQTAWTVTVTDVVDGDTMDVRMPDGSTDTIRLLGVDTPETSASETAPEDWEEIPTSDDSRRWLADWGGQATSFAEERVSTGSEIYIEVDEEADRRGSFDRLLVYAYQDEEADTSFNLRLLEEGYARVYDSEFSKRAEFDLTEIQARDAEKGAWGYTEPTEDSSSDSSGSGSLSVANVHADADGNDHENLDDEYIVFENTGGSSLDMGGWTISDSADHTYTVPSGFTLGAGESVTVYTGSGSDSDTELYWGSGGAVWNNSGDTIIVENEDGETVIEYEY